MGTLFQAKHRPLPTFETERDRGSSRTQGNHRSSAKGGRHGGVSARGRSPLPAASPNPARSAYVQLDITSCLA
jgi:hypothetical protein